MSITRRAGGEFGGTLWLVLGGTGPAVIVGGWALSRLWLFWVAPLLGAVCAGLGYRLLAGDETQAVGGGVREVTIASTCVR